jgi:hypothetical protein
MTNFEEITLRLKTSSRGGGIEISLSSFAKKYKGHKMTAYQNYLGGGLLGAVGNDCTIPNWRDNKKLQKIALELRQYFFNLTNPDEEEQPWEHQEFEQNQNMPISAY